MRRIIISLVTVLVLGAAGCGGGNSTQNNAPTSSPLATIAAVPTRPNGSPTTVISLSPTADATAAAPASPAANASPAATNPPSGNTPAPTLAVLPTPTTKPSVGNPASASVGVTGTVNFFWSPANVSLAPGGTVTFSWTGATFHDLSIPLLGIENGATKSAAYPVTFPNPGTYAIICQVHPSMKGTVTVQ